MGESFLVMEGVHYVFQECYVIGISIYCGTDDESRKKLCLIIFRTQVPATLQTKCVVY